MPSLFMMELPVRMFLVRATLRGVAVAVLAAGVAHSSFGCAGAPSGRNATMEQRIGPEVGRSIDSALQSLGERLGRVRSNDFPEQVVSLYGPPSRIRHKIEKGSLLDIQVPLAREVIFTMYIYDLYELAARVEPELAAQPREAVYARASMAGLAPELHFVFINARLYAVSDHEFF